MSRGRDGKGCPRCICCCYYLLVLLIAIATCLAYYFYNIERPKVPTYAIQSFNVKSVDVKSDLSLKTEFMVEVKTTNPNKNIAFIYGADSDISFLHNDIIISTGKLPAFKQDPANTTVFEIALSGSSKNEIASLQDDVKNHHKDGGEIPLVVHVKVPVKVFVGNVGLKEFMASISCDLVVDKLELGKAAKVLKNDCEPDMM